MVAITLACINSKLSNGKSFYEVNIFLCRPYFSPFEIVSRQAFTRRQVMLPTFPMEGGSFTLLLCAMEGVFNIYPHLMPWILGFSFNWNLLCWCGNVARTSDPSEIYFSRRNVIRTSYPVKKYNTPWYLIIRAVAMGGDWPHCCPPSHNPTVIL